MGHCYWSPPFYRTIGNNYGREAVAFSGRLFELVQLASIINGSLLDNLDYGRYKMGHYWACGHNNGRDAAFFKIGAAGINKWVAIVQLGSGLFAFGQLQKLCHFFSITKSFKFLFSLQLNTKPANSSTQNHYGCKAVSSVASSLLFHLP